MLSNLNVKFDEDDLTNTWEKVTGDTDGFLDFKTFLGLQVKDLCTRARTHAHTQIRVLTHALQIDMIIHTRTHAVHMNAHTYTNEIPVHAVCLCLSVCVYTHYHKIPGKNCKERERERERERELHLSVQLFCSSCCHDGHVFNNF